MATPYTPNGDTWVATFTEPEDLDSRQVALNNAPFEAVANQAAWMKRRGLWLPDLNLEQAALVLVPLGVPLANTDSRFVMDSSYRWIHHDTTSAGLIAWRVPVPPAMAAGAFGSVYLKSCLCYYSAGSGHGGVPTTPPTLAIKTMEIVTGSVTTQETWTCTKLDVPSYEGPTSWGGDLSPSAVDVGNSSVIVEVTGEFGTNKIDDRFLIHAIRCGWGVKP